MKVHSRSRLLNTPLRLIAVMCFFTVFWQAWCRAGSPVEAPLSPSPSLHRLGTLHGTGGEFAQFSADGRLLLTAYFADARLWDVQTMKPVWPVLHLKAQIEAVQFLDSGKQVLIAADDGVTIYDASTGNLLKTVFAFKRPLALAAVSADGEVVAGLVRDAGSGFRENIVVGSVSQGKVLWELPASDVHFLRVNSNHQIMFVLLGDTFGIGVCQLWDLRSGKQIESDFSTRYVQRIARDSTHTPAAFSADGRRIVIADENSFRVLDAYTTASITSAKPDRDFGRVRAVAFVDHDRSIAVHNDSLLLADSRTGQWRLPDQIPGAVENRPYLPWITDNHLFSADGKFGVSSMSWRDALDRQHDGDLRVFRIADGTKLGTATLNAPGEVLAISPDDRLLATSDGESNDTMIWRLP